MALPPGSPINFTIAFEGLMMFHNPPTGKAHLAVVDAHNHVPRIFIYRKDVPEPKKYPLEAGDRVTFETVRRGPIKTDTFFKEHVPTMNDYVVRGHVHDDVVAQQPKRGVLAYAELPTGNMTTWHNLKDVVELTRRSGESARVCFARFAVLQPPPAKRVVLKIYRYDPFSYDIEDGDVVIISNIEPQVGEHFDSNHPHFPEYAHLLSYDAIIGAMKILTGGCDPNEESDQVDPEVGEILTHHNPVPNGDCGPVNNP